MISEPADNYLRAAHYLFYLLSLNGRAGQITRETNYLWVTIQEKLFASKTGFTVLETADQIVFNYLINALR